MLSYFSTSTGIVKIITIILLTSAFVLINWPFFLPILLASIFSLGTVGLVNQLKRKLKVKPVFVISIFIISGIAIFWIPMAFLIYRIFHYFSNLKNIESGQITNKLEAIKSFFISIFQKISENTGFEIAEPARNLLESILSKSGLLLINFSSQFISQLPSILLSSFIFFIFLFLFLLHAPSIKDNFFKYSPLQQKTNYLILSALKSSCYTTLFSTLVVGLVQAILIGIGSLIFNQGDFLFVTAITFLLSFVPVFGAAPVGFILALMAFLDNQLGSAIGLMIFALIAGSVDNLLKPMIVSGKSKVSPAISFTCVVGAVIMLGLPGLLLGPVIMSLSFQLIPILIQEEI